MKRNLRYAVLILLLTGTFAVQGQTPSSNQNYVTESVIKTKGKKTAASLSGLVVDSVNKVVRYFDGLGRSLQVVSWQGSPSKRDLVTPIAYDANGREDKKYLPYAAQAGVSNGSYKSAALTDQNSFYTSPGGTTWTAPGVVAIPGAAFSKTVFESSPLNRVTEQGAAGSTWQPVSGSTAGHTVKLSYGTNNTDITYPGTTGYGVRLYRADVVAGTGHEHERTLFTDAIYNPGTLFLTITYDENWTGSGKAGTTEEYKDNEGRIVLKRNFGQSGTATDVLSTYYVYDDFGNLSFVLPPGVNPDVPAVTTDLLNKYCYQYRYDSRKRLIEKRIPGTDGWAQMVYNLLDQLVLSQDPVQALGVSPGPYRSFTKYDGLGRVIMTGVESGHTLDRATVQDVVNNMPYNWDTRSNTAGNYHGYNNLSAPYNTSTMDVEIVNYYDDYAIPNLPVFPSAGYSSRTSGLLTATKVKVMGTAGTFLWTVNYYDDEGRLVKQYKQHYLSGAVSAANYDEISNTYNFASELTASTRIHHVGTVGTTIANRYSYDHMGRKLLSWESVGGAAEIVLSKLEYNETGELIKKSLHSTDLGATFLQSSAYGYNERGWLKTSSSAQFSYELKYQDGTTPQYNGNIANQLWGAAGNNPNNFTYSYDKLNRLRTGASTGIVMSEILSYDAMGNINSLNRDGVTGSYTYTGNRLNKINGGTMATGTYGYDANGNATTDGRTGVVLTYNHLNLPVTAAKTGLALFYIYDATGNKLRKTSNGAVRQYIDGIEYNGTALETIQTEEGLVRKSGTTYSYEYNLTDHLGNVRYSFYKHPTTGALTKLAETNYYPFGKTNVVLQGNNKYLYNGKELQDELGQYDYGARFYDPVIGRWNVVDPLAEQMRRYSPYVYGFNNPIRFIDPDGMKPLDDYVFNQLGNYVRTDKNDKADKLVIENSETGKSKSYDFNDPENDVKAINNAIASNGEVGINKVAVLGDAEVEKAITTSGVKNAEAQKSPLSYALAQGAKKMDYGISGIRSGALDPKSFYIREGTAYNVGDIGNYMWGRGMAELGVSLEIATVGAHYNNIFHGREQKTQAYNFGPNTYGAPGFFDSPDDQRAIRNGYGNSPAGIRVIQTELRNIKNFSLYGIH